MVRPLTLIGGVLAALSWASAMFAAPPGSISDMRVGLASGYKLGHWTPVWVTLTAGDELLAGDLQITVPDGDDVPATFAGGQLSGLRIPAGVSRTVVAYVRIGRRQAQLQVQLVSGAARDPLLSQTLRAAELPPATLASQQRVVVVGGKLNLAQATAYLPRNTGEEIVTATIESASALPDRWYGYDGVDALVLIANRPAFYDELSAAQQQAIVEWIEQGGRAILAVGSQGEAALREGSFLAQLAPGRLERVMPLRETTALETFIDAPTRLDAPVDGRNQPPLVAVQLHQPQGEVLAAAGLGHPLVLRSPLGFGEVLFVALDLDRAPIAGWADEGRLLAKLLEALWRGAPPSDQQHRSGEAAHLGFDDLTGQLTAALDQFPGVRLIPFSWVAGLVVLYIVLIGPADYFLLRRVGRMELTWLTFSLVAVALGTAAWGLAGWARGKGVRVNQVEIVDVDAQTAHVRGTTWLRIYSPHNQRFHLQLEPASESAAVRDRAVLFAWQGVPGRSLSGMDAVSRAELDAQRYVIGDTAAGSKPPELEVQELSLTVGATKGFVARWWGESQLQFAEPPLTTSAEKLLRGRVVNPLAVRLTGCVLYHDRWAYKLGTLEAGQGVTLDDAANPLDVQWLLTQRTVIESREVTKPWDRAQRDDLPRILEMLMFHELAGGRGYTGLLHRYDQFIDLSGHLTAGRAVLVGKADASPTRLIVNGEPLAEEQSRHWTYCRIVLPTTPEQRGP